MKREKDPACRNVLIYSNKVSDYEYSPSHPFKPARARMMLELLNRYSLFNRNESIIKEPQALKEKHLFYFHTYDYIQVLKKCDRGEYRERWPMHGLGTSDNPVFKGVYDYSVKSAGGTLTGAELILGNRARMVFNPLGGFHHAMRDRAEGFCYINDLVIAIIHLVNSGKRVAYVDIDVHHGDGVQEAFYDTDRVLTISIHESGYTLFPGTGFEYETGEGEGKGYNVNIPLLNYSDDEVYLYAFNKIVPKLLEKFRPDVIVAQLGPDAHRTDPLANLNITSNAYGDVVKTINEFAPFIIATGGGGYNPNKAASMWALAWANLTGQKPEDLYAGAVGGMMYGPEKDAGSLYDEPFVLKGTFKDQCMDYAKKIVEYHKNNTFHFHS